MTENIGRLVDLWSEFCTRYDQMLEYAHEQSLASDVRRIEESSKGLTENIADLRNVLRYRKTKARAIELGVGAFVDYIVREDDGKLDFLRVFD